VKIHVGIWTKEPVKYKRDYVSNSEGRAMVKLPRTFYILRLWADTEGHVPLFVHWERDWIEAGQKIPEEFTFRMTKGTVVGGVIKNEYGEPIEGVKVEVRLDFNSESQNEAIPSVWLANGEDARTTGTEGQWTLDNVPEGDDELTLKLTHPDYVSDFFWGLLQKIQEVTAEDLRKQTATLVMPRGIRVTGTITDPQGKPIEGAVVVWGDDPYLERAADEVYTDEKGVYRFPPLPPAPLNVTVMAEGWMPELRKIEIVEDNPPVDFQLNPGRKLRIKFVDEEGKPIPEVGIGIAGWRGIKSLYNHKHSNVLDAKIPDKADENGVYEWTWAPDDWVEYNFWKEGYRSVRDESIRARDGEIEFILPK
jgi:hypothetical protein